MLTSNKMQPENVNKKFNNLINDIQSGQIKLPMFQREFVWNKEQSAKLIDSILKGYPIGTFIFWKTKEPLKSLKNIGDELLPETPKGDYTYYILDGQQRITSLYAINQGLSITKDNETINYKEIYINLDYDIEKDEQIVCCEKEVGKKYISVHQILRNTTRIIQKNNDFSDEQLDIIDIYKSRFESYDFPAITIQDYPIEITCDIFSRINTSGKSLTLFEIMVARTYDEERNFDLAQKYEELVNRTTESTGSCLADSKFETISNSIVLQAFAAITIGSVRSKDILKISQDKFFEHWDTMVSAMFGAIDFIRSGSGLIVPTSYLLPYEAILISLTYFFYKNKKNAVTHKQTLLLQQFFYWVGLNKRYSGSADTKINEDLKKMDQILEEEIPQYDSEELCVKVESLNNNEKFSPRNAYTKTILCFLASKNPLDFQNNNRIILDNSNLKVASSKNYHHFFPKKYIKKYYSHRESNLIGNITLIRADTNNKIRDKDPNTYIQDLLKENSDLCETLKTHLIDDITIFGIKNNDYDLFIEKRSTAIANGLNELLNPRI